MNPNNLPPSDVSFKLEVEGLKCELKAKVVVTIVVIGFSVPMILKFANILF